MKFVQINGVLLTVEMPSSPNARPASNPNPWDIEGITDLVAAMTGTAVAPVMVEPPALTPSAVQAGEPVAVFLGTWAGTSPVGVLRMNGTDVTSDIADGVYIPNAVGTLTLSVTAGPLQPVSVSATVSAAAPVPTAPAAIGINDWELTTGSNPGEVNINILSLPADGGSAINALRYQVGDGTPQTLPGGTGTGSRSVSAGEAGASVSVVVWAVNGVGAASPSQPKSATTGAITQAAPSVQTPPTIAGSTTVGSILTRTAGTATGIPTPSRATVWLRNGEVIAGQTGNTLDTSGFAADDVITTRDDWANSQGTASGTSAPWTLTIQPAITATIDLQPAGQQSSITFNVAIDGSPTIAQGATSITATRVGTTNQWTFVAPVEGPISFAATKAGYTAFSDATRTVAPAPSVLVIRDRELMVDNEPTAGRTLDIIAPDRFAATGINIAADQYTNGMKVIAAPIIARNGDVITASRGGLFSWFAEQEPVFFSHDYYRGASPQTATLIPGTADVESYAVDPAADGGSKVYRRDRMVNALQASVAVFSNGIAVAAAGWWDPLVDAYPGSLQVDYAGDRARINGVTYNSIAAAKSAGAILVDGTTEYTPITIGTACATVGSGIVTRSTTAGQVLFAADDGQDADNADNHISNFLLNSHVMRPTVASNGSTRLAAGSSPTYATGEACSVGISINATNTAYWKTLKDSGSSTVPGMMPAGLTRFCYGGRTVTNAPWLGTKKQFIFINGPVSNAELDALVGAIQ